MQTKIVKEMRVLSEIDVNYELKTRVAFLKEQLQKTNLTTLVLGISGGQDSTLAGKLCQLAIDDLNQEFPEKNFQFIAVRLPYGTQFDEADCQLALKFIEPSTTFTVDIKPAVDTQVAELTQAGVPISDFNKGNIKARQRMIVQFAIAAAHHGLVVGTDHSAESVTGFYTKFGDGAADIIPLFGLCKSQGRELLKALDCPEQLYLKEPTADLEEERPALADTVALGVSYEQIDSYLKGETIDSNAAARVEELYLNSAHKRALPITIYD